MFGDLLGNLEEKQAAMQDKLAAVTIEESAGDGAIKIQANGLREVLNISIDKEKIDLNDVEELEDLLLVAFNRLTDKIVEQEEEVTKNSMKDILPPGMGGGLGNLFG